MKTLRTLSQTLIALLLAAGVAMPTLAAEPLAAQTYQVAQGGNCHAIGQQYAAQMGGQLARASAESRGGQQVCVIVVLLPAKDGQRPRREEIVVPAG
jgi:starvation-inducible outer membrane lipoprotein